VWVTAPCAAQSRAQHVLVLWRHPVVLLGLLLTPSNLCTYETLSTGKQTLSCASSVFISCLRFMLASLGSEVLSARMPWNLRSSHGCPLGRTLHSALQKDLSCFECPMPLTHCLLVTLLLLNLGTLDCSICSTCSKSMKRAPASWHL
jgi:hypothetical protein